MYYMLAEIGFPFFIINALLCKFRMHFGANVGGIFFVLLYFVAVSAEWPPKTCTRDATIKDGALQLTSSGTVQSTCKLAQMYDNEVYVSMSRFYTNKNHNYRRVLDSKIVLTVNDDTDSPLFDVEIHSDKVQTILKRADKGVPPNRCFGIFFNEKPWQLKVEVQSFYDLQKTVVGVATSKHGRGFKSCFRFELDRTLQQFTLDVGGMTESGMEQWVHDVRATSFLKATGDVSTRVVSLERDLKALTQKVKSLTSVVSQQTANHNQRIDRVDSRHTEMRKDLRSSQSRNTLSIQRYSYMSWTLVVFVCVFVGGGIKFMQHYISKRDKII